MAKTMNDVLSYIKSVRKKNILIPKNSKDNTCISLGAVNQAFIVYKKIGIIREGECTSQLVN